MSGNRPAKPQRRELEIMRVLFERRLKDRAIALSDSRWPGSGKMVDLAYEWGQLDPAERRERLSAIGPEEIARLREFTELNPELSRAVDELDRRGVLPHIEAAAVDVAEASRQTNAANGPATETPAESSATAPTDPEAITTEAQAVVEEAEPTPAVEPEPKPEYDFEDRNVDAIEVDMPNLDLGLPSTTEFLQEETGRREEASRAAEEAMDRVRRNLEQATQRAFDRSASFGMPKMPEISRPEMPSVSERSAPTATRPETRTTARAIDAPKSLARHLADNVVAVIGADDPRPSDDQLVSLANDLQIGFTEHTVRLGNRKQVYGGLVQEYGRIQVRPGTIAQAIAGPNLLVVHGRLPPQLIERIEEGYFDIPGTRASVEVHPKARVVVLGAV